MAHQKTIAIDVDGTIYDHSDGWHGEEHFGALLPDAAEIINLLHMNGWFIIINTCRGSVESVSKQLKSDGIHFDLINEQKDEYKNSGLSGKPVADVYLDDRGVQFRGDWKQALKDVLEFKPWHEGEVSPDEDA